MGGACSTHGRRQKLENLKRGYHLEELSVDGRIILKLISEKRGRKLWTGFIWLRIGTSGGLL